MRTKRAFAAAAVACVLALGAPVYSFAEEAQPPEPDDAVELIDLAPGEDYAAGDVELIEGGQEGTLNAEVAEVSRLNDAQKPLVAVIVASACILAACLAAMAAIASRVHGEHGDEQKETR